MVVEKTNRTYEEIIDDRIHSFLAAIKKDCQIDSKKLRLEKSDYPLFRPANSDYFEYKHFEGVLEWFIRDHLISGIIFDLLIKQNIQFNDYHFLAEKSKVVRSQYSNESFGDDYPLAFIVQNGDNKIGYRYSGACLNDEELMSWLEEYQLHHIEIIDWTDSDSYESKKIEWGVSLDKRELVYYITLRKFMAEYFPEEIYEQYIAKVRNAVEQANKEIGFQTRPQLSLRYLSDFKSSVLNETYNRALRALPYQEFDKKGKVTDKFMQLLPSDDYDKIDNRFKDMGLYKALVGKEKFAKCFITSEYLYQVFKKGNENSFDYSTVASGYFKSVELLLEKIMLVTLNANKHENLWIKCSNGNYKDTHNFRDNPNPKAKGKQVRFANENHKHFSTEMGPLIWFLHDNTKGWYISEEGRDIVHKCLLNYNQGCRNGHLHKDIIDDIETIGYIRNNTLLCLYYLIGGCLFSEDQNRDYELLCIEDDSFDRLYKALVRIPRSVKNYYMQFGSKEAFKAVRLYDQKSPCYDENGNLQSTIRFVKVDDFYIEDYESFLKTITEDNEIIVSRNNKPSKLWYTIPKKGRVLIEWQ